MTLDVDRLGAPAATVVRAQARQLLAESASGVARLVTPDDPEALHDARVALRRLRSWLRAFPEEAGVPPRVVRRLGRLARATGAARDLEVAAERLATLARRARGARREALVRMSRRLASRGDAGRASLVDEVEKRWHGLQPALARALRAGARTRAPRFANLVAARIAAAAAAFGGPPPPAADGAALHALRIAGKRVRYLVEPLRGVEPSAEAVLRAMKALQEHLGAVNDAVVLEQLLIAEAEEVARAAVLANSPSPVGARALRDVANAMSAVRAWRRRLERAHAREVVARIARLRPALGRMVRALRARRTTVPTTRQAA